MDAEVVLQVAIGVELVWTVVVRAVPIYTPDVPENDGPLWDRIVAILGYSVSGCARGFAMRLPVRRQKQHEARQL